MEKNAIVRTADIVVVGAGVMGASLAFHLAERNACRVVLLDKDHVGRGASGRSSALIRMHYTFPAEVQLAVKSLEIFLRWKEIVGEPSDFRKVGFVRIVPPSESENLKRNVEMQKSLGANTRVVSRQELKDIEPDWFVDDIDVAAYEPDSGYGDGTNVAAGFLSRACELGVTYLPKTRAQKILVSASQVFGVATSRGEIHAPSVVLATGNWTKELTDPLGIDVPIETEYHEVAIVRSAQGMKLHGSACVDTITKIYFRSDGRDKTLVGTMSGERPVDPENFPERPTHDSLAQICEMACRRIPALKEAELMRCITGVYDVTPDSRALLGRLLIDGLFVVAGFSGMGFKISPAVGLTMSELIIDGQARTVDLTAFRPSRFAEGHPIRPAYEYAGLTSNSGNPPDKVCPVKV
jgi:sarcosine oxidase subunit beta